jgi:6-pyruvoyl-tetrahydropterin synthase related domain
MSDSAAPREPQKRLQLTRRDRVAYLIIFALAAIVMLPIFLQYFPNGHDAAWHYRWAGGFINALAEGSLYPRWHAEADFGQGSPVFIYYPPLSFYVVAAFSTVATEPIAAIKLACWLALTLSGLTMYAFGRSFFSCSISLLAAAFYLLAPYHLFDLYTRSALSEFWAIAWVPLLLHTARRACLGGEARAVAYLAMSYALMVFTNVPIAFAITVALVIYVLCMTRDLRRLTRFAAGLTLGAGLAAIYAVPVVFERKYVNIDRILGFYRDLFLYTDLGSVFNAPAAAPGPGTDLFLINSNWIALGLLPLFALASLIIWNRRGLDSHSRFDAPTRRAIWVITAFSLLMTARISLPIWQVIPGISVIQFPTRWLLIVSAGVSLLVADSISILPRSGKLRFIYAGALASAIAFNLAISALTVARTPLNDRWYKGRQLSNIETREYHPVWWDGERHEELEEAPAIVSSGDAHVSAIDDSGVRQSYEVSASTESALRFRTLYFPGWVARADGRAIGIEPSKEGNILLTIEPGERTLTLSFEDTWPRSAGKLLSVISFMLWLAILLRPVFRIRRQSLESESETVSRG